MATPHDRFRGLSFAQVGKDDTDHHASPLDTRSPVAYLRVHAYSVLPFHGTAPPTTATPKQLPTPFFPQALSLGNARRNEEFRSSHDWDSLVVSQGQQVSAVARDDVRRARDHCTFQDLIVVRVRGNHFEVSLNGN